MVVYFNYDFTLEVTRTHRIFQMFKNDTETNWYKLDIYLYKDLIIALVKCKNMDDVMQLWELGRHEKGGFVP